MSWKHYQTVDYPKCEPQIGRGLFGIRLLIAELRLPEGPPGGAPNSYRKEKETHELIFSWLSWPAALLVGAYARRRRSRPTRLGLPCTSLILDIHVVINWHLSKEGICWPVSRDHIAGSSLQFIEAFFKLTADQVLVFDWTAGSCQVNLLKTGQDCTEVD